MALEVLWGFWPSVAVGSVSFLSSPAGSSAVPAFPRVQDLRSFQTALSATQLNTVAFSKGSSELVFQKHYWREMGYSIKTEELLTSGGDPQGEVMKFSRVSVTIHEFNFLWLDNLSLTLLPYTNSPLGEGKMRQHHLVALSSIHSHCFCHKAWVPTLDIPIKPCWCPLWQNHDCGTLSRVLVEEVESVRFVPAVNSSFI